jgi:hypothetical protein
VGSPSGNEEAMAPLVITLLSSCNARAWSSGSSPRLPLPVGNKTGKQIAARKRRGSEKSIAYGWGCSILSWAPFKSNSWLKPHPPWVGMSQLGLRGRCVSTIRKRGDRSQVQIRRIGDPNISKTLPLKIRRRAMGSGVRASHRQG